MCRTVRVEGNIAYVPLTRGYEAIVDASDASLVGGPMWQADVKAGTVYAKRTVFIDGIPRSQLMHRLIVPAMGFIDHIDGNGLNNRRSNLREATAQQNAYNQRKASSSTSGFKGVSWSKSTGRWQASIRAHGKLKYLGVFETAVAAAEAYNEAALSMFGQFAQLNITESANV